LVREDIKDLGITLVGDIKDVQGAISKLKQSLEGRLYTAESKKSILRSMISREKLDSKLPIFQMEMPYWSLTPTHHRFLD
jgi:hypothetical protein